LILKTTSFAKNGVPFVKSHVRTKLELPGGLVQRLPGNRKLRDNLQVRVHVEERLVDLFGRRAVRCVVIGMWVQGERAA
jgi:hypothetical protein